MTSYLRLGGAIIVLLAVLFIGREYSAFASKRLAELRGFCDLLRHIENGIANYLNFGMDLWGDFSCDALEKCGFLASLRGGDSPSSAFAKCERSLSLTDDQKSTLDSFFSGFGREYRDGELRRIGECREVLADCLKNEEIELEKRVKVVRALLLGAGLSLVILVI